MIFFNFALHNPWHNEKNWPWKDLWQKSWTLTKNKSLEVCVDYYPYTFAYTNINLRWKGIDHAGPEFGIGFLGLGLQIQINDSRHWDYDTNDWQKYD